MTDQLLTGLSKRESVRVGEERRGEGGEQEVDGGRKREMDADGWLWALPKRNGGRGSHMDARGCADRR